MSQKAASCRLCGLALPAGTPLDHPFCCAGCARVYEVLQGLDASTGQAYLEAVRQFGIIPSSSRIAVAVAPYLPNDPAALRRQRFQINGLVCPSCSWVAEQVLLSQLGVHQAEVNFFSSSCLLEFDLRQVSLEQLDRLLSPLGYRLLPLEVSSQKAERSDTFAFVVSAVLCCNLMSVSFLRYAYTLGWISELPVFLIWLELGLTLPVLYLGWIPMLRRSWRALFHGRIIMDALVSLAVGASFLLSLAAMVGHRNDIYFETSAGLVTIFLLSRMMEGRLRRKALSELATLLHMPVQRVRLEAENGALSYPTVQSVETGNHLLFYSQELIPFDGWVAGDTVFVSEAVLTGEPHSVAKQPGERILAGSTVQEGVLRLHVERPYTSTRLYAIAQVIRQSLETGENRLRSADCIARWFTPTVIAISLLTWVIRALLAGWDMAFSAAVWFPSVAVLAVACPCAFSLAGITAVSATLANLLKQGILVKEPSQLEQLHRIRDLLFDKTGTISQGLLSVEQVLWRNEPQTQLLQWAANAEKQSNHPVAKAILRHLKEQKGIEPSSEKAGILLRNRGCGLEISDLGIFQVGAADLFQDLFNPSEISSRHTLAWFGFPKQAEGCFLLSDPLRPEADAVVRELSEEGYCSHLVSGDRQDLCQWIGSHLGFRSTQGCATLEQKVEIVTQMEQAGRPVVFIGDGTNDALAMNRASASIALSHASDEALAIGGFILLSGQLQPLPFLFRTARKLARVIRHNYWWAFGFNSLFIPLAALGYLTPLWAMLLMLLSSTAVLLNSLRMHGS